jgi:hypothetical protein
MEETMKQKKKMSLLSLACVMLAALVLTVVQIPVISPVMAQGEENTTAETGNFYVTDDYNYRLSDDGTASICKFKGEKTVTKIPDIPKTVTKDGKTYNVTTIGGIFKECTALTNVTIPDFITTLSKSCFEGCTGLTSVTIPSSVVIIDDGAFKNCTGLTTVVLSSGITSIGISAFEGCTSLKSIAIPGTVKTIAKGAFKDCTGLTSVTLSNGITTIDNAAFEKCTSLMSVTLPGSITTLGQYVFNHCTSLESVVYGEGIKDAGVETFIECSKLTSVELPSTLVTIGEKAFGASNIKNITIPGSVTSIGANALASNAELAITIPCNFDTSLFAGSGITVNSDGTYKIKNTTKEFTITHNYVNSVCKGCGEIDPDSVGTPAVIATDAPVESAAVSNDLDELTESGIFTEAELQEIKNGTPALNLTVAAASQSDYAQYESAISSKAVEKLGTTPKEIMYLDLTLTKNVGDKGKISEFTNSISITVQLPTTMIKTNGKTDNYVVIRVHDGVTETITPDKFDASSGNLTFKTNKFSTYAVAYVENASSVTTTGTASDGDDLAYDDTANKVTANKKPAATQASTVVASANTGAGTGTGSGSTAASSPKTGDTANILGLFAMMAAGLAVVAGGIAAARKKVRI